MNDQKSSLYLWGAMIGLVLGVVSAHLYGRALEENAEDGNAPTMSAGDLVGMSMLLLGIVRQVSDYSAKVGSKNSADKGKKKK